MIIWSCEEFIFIFNNLHEVSTLKKLDFFVTITKKNIYTTPFIKHLKSPAIEFCVKTVNDVEILIGIEPRPFPNAIIC